jgi:hypothetical protein
VELIGLVASITFTASYLNNHGTNSPHSQLNPHDAAKVALRNASLWHITDAADSARGT